MYTYIIIRSTVSFDGFSSVDGIVSRAKELGMRAVGLTDHGTFAGAIAFLKACRKAKIKPILGMESYFCRNLHGHTKEDQPDGRRGNRHINLIAKNRAGLRNIKALSQISSLEGYYYDPRIDWDTLYQHREGIIVTSACLSNVINWHLSCDRYEKAKKAAAGFKEVFGDDFYLEVMFHGIDKEGKILPLIQRLGRELNVKVIATNDCHYINKNDAEFHEILMCMSSGRCIRDPKRIKFPYSEFYFKSQDEMYKLFGHVSKYLTNTLDIAEKCDYTDLIFIEDGGEMRLPHFDIPENFSGPLDYLEHLAWNGLRSLKLDKSEPHVQRLKQELSDIRLIWDTKRYDFATYFLIVDDIMRYAREKNIAAGIRGSGYGSVLIKCLKISEGIDPLEHDLLWERFLGFDSSYFVSEGDFGIQSGAHRSEEKQKIDTSSPTEIMTERYK